MFKDRKNPADPLLKRDFSSDNSRALFTSLSKCANGFNQEDVITAAVNLLINAVRQQSSNRTQAEAAMNELFGRTKAVLSQHYDWQGNRTNVFPFDQNIIIPPFVKQV